MTIGERIKEIRTQKGIKQKELANKIGISYVMLSQYERGERKPKLGMIDKIALALDVQPIELAYGKNNPFVDDTKRMIRLIKEGQESVKLITEKISAVLKSLDENNIEYTITDQTEKDNYILEIKVTLNNSDFTLDTDDLIDIYDKAQAVFNNSVKNIIDIISTYKKQGD